MVKIVYLHSIVKDKRKIESKTSPRNTSVHYGVQGTPTYQVFKNKTKSKIERYR